MLLNIIKSVIIIGTLIVSASATLYIGSVYSEDITSEELAKINEVFLDVWSEKTVFNRLSDIPKDDFSRYVRSLNLNTDEQVVTGYVLVLGEKAHLRVDVYDADGARIHVSREIITSIDDIYAPMLRTRDQYYTPIQETAESIQASSAHQFGWSLTLGAVFAPHGYEYTVLDSAGVYTTLEPYSFALIDLALVDMVGKYRDILLYLYLHGNVRADIGIGMGVKKVILKSNAHSPTVSFEAGLNKLIIQDVMGDDTKKNYVGSRDGVMLTPRVGMLFFRDQKINIYTDFGWAFIMSERKGNYPHINFGIMSSWGKKKK